MYTSHLTTSLSNTLLNYNSYQLIYLSLSIYISIIQQELPAECYNCTEWLFNTAKARGYVTMYGTNTCGTEAGSFDRYFTKVIDEYNIYSYIDKSVLSYLSGIDGFSLLESVLWTS